MRRVLAGSLLVFVLVVSPRVNAEAAPPSPSVAHAAQELYTAGRESYRIALYGRALEEFERSIALVPSPNARLYIARALRELGRWPEVAEQYRTTIREAEERGAKYAATREAAEIELRDVEVRLARGASPSASAAAAGALLYGLASHRYGYLEDHCRAARDASCDDARTSGRREEIASYVVLGVATALATVAVLSFFTSGTSKRTGHTAWPLAF